MENNYLEKQNFIELCDASICVNGSRLRKRRKENSGNCCSTNDNRSNYNCQRFFYRKKVSFEDTQRVGREESGYINVPKDWATYQDKHTGSQFQFSSPDKYNILSMNAYTKDSVKLKDNEKFGAELLANRLYNNWENNKEVKQIQGVKAKFAGEQAFLMKVVFTDGKYMYEWVFQKGEKVYDVALEGTADTINTLRPFFEQSWGLDPKTPGK